jgi:hypothetical protein
VVYKKSLKINKGYEDLKNHLDVWFQGGDDIIVEVDGSNFNQQDYNIIQQLNDIIKDTNQIGEYKIGNFKNYYKFFK